MTGDAEKRIRGTKTVLCNKEECPGYVCNCVLVTVGEIEFRWLKEVRALEAEAERWRGICGRLAEALGQWCETWDKDDFPGEGFRQYMKCRGESEKHLEEFKRASAGEK